MSGKRQHYIPRLLMRGFFSRVKNKNVSSIIYKYGCPAFENNIMKIGYEDYFYDCPEIAADNFITVRERDFILLVNNARDYCEVNDADLLNQYVVHISMRSKFFRDLIILGVEEIYSNFSGYFSQNGTGLDAFLKSMSTEDKIRRIIISILEEKNIPRNEENIQFAMDRFHGTKDGIFDGIKKRVASEFQNIDKVISRMPCDIKKQHIMAIYADDEPTGWLEKLKNIEWSVVCPENGEYLIFGDCGPLIRDNYTYKPLITSSGAIEFIFFPVSFNRLLVGVNKDVVSKLDDMSELINFDDINTACAEMSSNFFISNARHERNEYYHAKIGSKWKELFDFKELFGDLLREKKLV